ncbi:chromate transporter, partial [Plantactinospora sp. ZYX-F-223]
LTGITAAVVGVIANLGLYFTVHTLFADSRTVTGGPLRLELPEPAAVRWVPLAIAVIAGVLIFRFRWSVLRVLGLSAVLGLGAGLAGLPVA